MSDEARIYLIRHGATSANEQRPYILQGGGVDNPLSDAGKQQAEAVGRFLSSYPLDYVYSSPLSRAHDTADCIAAPHGRVVESIDALREADVGIWEGMTWERIMEEHPEHYQGFMEDPGKVAYLGGESYADVRDRVDPVLTELGHRHAGQTIAVIAHQVVNRSVLAGLLGLELKDARKIRQATTGINGIRWQAGRLRLDTLNARFHLDGTNSGRHFPSRV